MRSNVNVGRGIINTRSAHNIVGKAKVAFNPAAAELARASSTRD